jgi:hypothetical protein
MSTVGYALASLLSLCFAPPDDAGTEAPVIIVSPTATPEPASEPPPPVPDWGPQGDVAVTQPAPRHRPPAPGPRPFVAPRQPMMGVGLFIGSAIAFGVGFGSRVGQVDLAVGNCRRWANAGFGNVTRCFDHFDPPAIDGNDLFVGSAYGASMVMTMIGAGALGQHDAWQTTFGDRKFRNPVSRYIAGAIFTGLGVAAIATHFGLLYNNAQNPCTSWECNVQRRALWVATSDGGALMLNTGLGLFSWAGNYRRNHDRYQRMYWTVVPGGTPGGAGMTALVQF